MQSPWARAPGGVLSVVLMVGLFLAIAYDLVPVLLIVPAFLLWSVLAIALQILSVLAARPPRLDKVASRLSEADAIGGLSQWSVGGTSTESVLPEALSVTSIAVAPALHGFAGASRVTVSYERVALVGRFSVPLTVVSVAGTARAGVVVASRQTGSGRQAWSRVVPTLGSPRTTIGGWEATASADAPPLDARDEAALADVSPRVQVVLWSRDAVHVVVQGHEQNAKVLRRLVEDAGRLARHAAAR